MKVVSLLKKLVVCFVALQLIAAASIFLWWRFGDWQARAIQDLEFIHNTILTHHPGPVDPENPGFLSLMNEALASAMPLARAARKPADHHRALDTYTDTFSDGHLSVAYSERVFGFLARRASNQSLPARSSGIDIERDKAWITIPSFSEQDSQIATTTAEIEAQAETLRRLETIVFDLRGNGGGDSSFATRIAIALWTDAVYRDWVPVSAKGVEWRASPENAEHVYRIARKHADSGRTRLAESWERIAERIDAAAAADEDLVPQNFSTREVTRTLESPISARVIAITDQACASACLDFMDKLMALPGVLHVGEETSSDTQYIDVRRVDLPSRTGALFIPLKVYRDRVRPAGGTYVPEIQEDAEILTQASLQAAIRENAAPNGAR